MKSVPYVIDTNATSDGWAALIADVIGREPHTALFAALGRRMTDQECVVFDELRSLTDTRSADRAGTGVLVGAG